MGVGYALVHPLGVEATIGHDAMRLGFDDGIDVVLAGIGVGDLGSTLEAVESLLQGQVEEIIEQFAGLLNGPLSGLLGLGSIFDEDQIDLVGVATKVADFLCNLEPAVIQGFVVGLLNQLSGHLPILQTPQIALRVRSIADALVSSFEAPLLSGRDDMEAHRGYRAAAMLRLLLRDVFDGLELFLASANPLGEIRSAVDRIPSLDEATLQLARSAGCWVSTNVVPMLQCTTEFQFNLSVDVDGPSGMPPPTAKEALLDKDSQPAPHEAGHWLWWMDLITGTVAFITTVFDEVRTGNPVGQRGFHFVADLFVPLWMAFRTLARAFRWPFINGPPDADPAGTPDDGNLSKKFVRFLFSDFGDFFVHVFLRFIGSISDMYAFSNWISSFGLAIVKYFFFTFQPRIPYLFLRSAAYMKEWDKLSDADKPGGIPMPRFAWLIYGPTALLTFIIGLFFGGFMWEDFGIQGSGPLWGLLASALSAIASFAFAPLCVLGRFFFFTPENLKRDVWQSALVLGLFVFVLLIALLTLFQTDAAYKAADDTGEKVGWVFAFLALIGLLIVGPAIAGGDWSHWTQYLAVLILGLAFPGTIMIIVWWFAIDDGWDKQDVFDGLDPATSPWLLPYPKGQTWLCGQDSHGFFSHMKKRPDGSENSNNHYSYDLNADFGSTVLAARPGVVVEVRDGLDDHNTSDPNEIRIQNLSWAPGHDPGWDQERAITYSTFLHLRKASARVNLGQVVRRGSRVAEVDDTGISAMNHLHFMGDTEQFSDNGIINMPIVFKDDGVRSSASLGFTPGKPNSLCFFTSDNQESTDLTPAVVNLALSFEVQPGSAPPANPHTHTVVLSQADLPADGSIPDSITLVTGPAGTPMHIHTLTLTRAQVTDLLHRRSSTAATTSSSEGHTHSVGPLPPQPDGFTVELSTTTPAGNVAHSHYCLVDTAALVATGNGSLPATLNLTTFNGGDPGHTHTLTLTGSQVQGNVPSGLSGTTTGGTHTHTLTALSRPNLSHRPAWFQIADPPPGRLLARSPGPYNLLGEQMLLRINGRTTEWFSFGANRPRIAGSLVLDRGPGSTAGIAVTHNGTVSTQQAGANLMPRPAAQVLTAGFQAAGVNAVVRAQPVIVIETRRRGSSASISVVSAPPGLNALTAAGSGTGPIPRLDQTTRQNLRDAILAAVTLQPAPPVSVTGAGDSRTITSGGNLSGFTGSTPRLKTVFDGLYNTATGVLGGAGGANPLPLGTGILRLNPAAPPVLDVPISAAPARTAISDFTVTRLNGANLTAEPLVITLVHGAQSVVFDAADTTPETLAARIMTQAEGVRAFAQGTNLVIETVAAGGNVTLALAKGAGTFPPVTPGSAPTIDAAGVRLADSTAVTLDELGRLIDSARAEAVKPTPAVTLQVPSGSLRIQGAAPTTALALEGPADLIIDLGATIAVGDATGRLTATEAMVINLPNTFPLRIGGWLDLTVDGTTWRIDLPAEPARAELALDGLPAAGSTLDLSLNGTAVPVPLAAADVANTQSLARRIGSAIQAALGADGATVRVASRYVVESAVHGVGDLTVGSAVSPGAAGAGVLNAPQTSRGKASYADLTTRVAGGGAPNANRFVDGTMLRTFKAVLAATTVTVSSADGSPITISTNPGGAPDPLGLVTASVSGGPKALGAQSVTYDVLAMGTTTSVEFNAAPAHLHTVARVAGVAIPDGADTLTVRTTSPAGIQSAATVPLRGANTLVEVAARIQREAPSVVCWIRNGNRLDIDTPGGGTGWQLRIEGGALLIALGFDSRLVDATGGIGAFGGGNVADGAAVTLDEVRDIVDTMGGLATLDRGSVYTVTSVGSAVRVESTLGAPALTSDPPSIALALAPTVAGNRLDTVAGPFRLTSGRISLRVGSRLAAVGFLWGRKAELEAPNPALAADLATLAGKTILVTVNGTPSPVPLPATAFATLPELIGHLNRNVGSSGQAWFGLVDRAGAKHLRIESRLRGSQSNISIEFIGTPAALGFVGNPTAATIPGGGNAGNLDQVTAAELVSILASGRDFAEAPQQAVDAAVAGNDLRLVARGGIRASLNAVTPPQGLALTAPAGRPDTLVAPYATPLDTGNHLTELTVRDSNTGPTITRTVRALLRLEPARLGPMSLPVALAPLNGRTLRLTEGTTPSTTFTTTFVAPITAASLIDQIERAGEGLVKASVTTVGGGSALFLETRTEGTSAALSVDTGASTAFAHLGAPPSNSASGAGSSAPNGEAVTAAEYRAALAAGIQGEGAPVDRSTPGRLNVRNLDHATIASGRIGSRSTVELLPKVPSGTFQTKLAAGPAAYSFSRSQAWGPAVRASIMLPPIAGTVNLAGDLWITLNDNGTAADVAPTAEVRVPLNGTFDAAGLADAIDTALGGVGSAGAFPDSTVVIESLAPGLTGAVRLPSATNASTPAVVSALQLTGPQLKARGWPGAGIAGGRSGFRGLAGNARANATVTFRVAVPPPPPNTFTTILTHNFTNGQTPAAAATAVNAAMVTAAGRTGFAAVGDDGALYVEFFAQAGPDVSLEPGTDFLRPDDARAEKIWEGKNLPLDPAFELRPTWVLRTFRAVYLEQPGADNQVFLDQAAFDPASARTFDLGWVRPPTDPNGNPRGVARWAPGRWLFSGRAEGARSDAFGPDRQRAFSPTGEMIVSAGTANVGGEVIHFARQVRYWMAQATETGVRADVIGTVSAPLRVVKFGDEFLLDHLVFRG